MARNETSIDVMYGKEDLAEYPIFQGGWINFGYWESLPPPSNRISAEERKEASRALYRKVFEILRIKRTDGVIEVGCGRGLGCALAVELYHPQAMIGIDFSNLQIERATHRNAAIQSGESRLSFIQAPAEKMPFSTNCFHALYSVEAAQHFSSIPQFLSEAHRILKLAGKMALTTFFAKGISSFEALQEALPTINKDIDRIIPIELILEQMRKIGFKSIECSSIGEKVFEGYDRWMAQIPEACTGWGRNWLKTFKQGLLDYYLISATKS